MGKLALKMHKMCLRKKLIRTEKHAKELAEYTSAKIGKKIYYYLCPICLNFHLTSKENYNGVLNHS